jgi:transaldolase
MDIKDQTQSSLNKLKEHSIIVADTGDINLIKETKPADATTNPSILLKAAEQKEYAYLVQDAIEYGVRKLASKDPQNKELIDLIMDRLFVNFGKEIL